MLTNKRLLLLNDTEKFNIYFQAAVQNVKQVFMTNEYFPLIACAFYTNQFKYQIFKKYRFCFLVSQGAKERLVQITGPTEEKIM